MQKTMSKCKQRATFVCWVSSLCPAGPGYFMKYEIWNTKYEIWNMKYFRWSIPVAPAFLNHPRGIHDTNLCSSIVPAQTSTKVPVQCVCSSQIFVSQCIFGRLLEGMKPFKGVIRMCRILLKQANKKNLLIWKVSLKELLPNKSMFRWW